jgi:hypothetical protein
MLDQSNLSVQRCRLIFWVECSVGGYLALAKTIICNTFDYMRLTFPFKALTKIGFLRIYFFNQFRENLNLPRHSFLRRL